MSPEAVDRARELGFEVRCLDIEEAGEEDPVVSGEVDVLVCLEVLEHLREPSAVLGKLRDALSAEGGLVISLPNEYHLISRLARLFGRSPLGGPDDPHLHHFERASALRLFEGAGLEVRGRLDDSIVPPRMPVLRWLFRPLLAVLPGLFSIAHVFLLGAKVEVKTR